MGRSKLIVASLSCAELGTAQPQLVIIALKDYSDNCLENVQLLEKTKFIKMFITMLIQMLFENICQNVHINVYLKIHFNAHLNTDQNVHANGYSNNCSSECSYIYPHQ